MGTRRGPPNSRGQRAIDAASPKRGARLHLVGSPSGEPGNRHTDWSRLAVAPELGGLEGERGPEVGDRGGPV